ncbi:DUF6884 domain-containing protein [Streptomyces sp. Edi2]|uniref:DUF6884 domain-containing protein n=1 Tax=Streptomyces sp. Edi2 TaxID=3162528 RepID=UPI003305DA20
MSPPAGSMSWLQRAALASARVHHAGHVPAAIRGQELQALAHRGLVEALPGIELVDLHRPCIAAQFRITAAGRRRAEATPRPQLIVVPCASRKSDQAVAAAEQMYIGSYHLAARKAALAVIGSREQLLVLSAKFGLLRLSDHILAYDLTSGQPGTVGPQALREQAHHLAVTGCRVTVLAGLRYAALARHVWTDLHHPLAGARGIGDHLAYFATQYGPPAEARETTGGRTVSTGPTRHSHTMRPARAISSSGAIT